MKIWERIFLYSIIAIMAFHLFLVDNKVESQGSVQEVIQAKQIEIVNDEGQNVVKLGTYNNRGAVTLYNQDGTRVVDIEAYKEGGAVHIYNGNQTGFLIPMPIAGMGPDTKGGGIISVSDKDGNDVAYMFSDEEGGVVSVYDKDDTIAVKMFVDQIEEIRGGGVVNVYNQDGTRVVDMSTYKEGGVVSVMGKDDTAAAAILADEEGGGKVYIFNKNEHLAVAMSGNRRDQTAIYNDEGNPLVGMRETDEGHGEIVVFSRGGKILGIIP